MSDKSSILTALDYLLKGANIMETKLQKLIFIISAISILSGCSSTFETRPFNEKTDGSGISNGISYYETQMVVLNYVFTQLIDAKNDNAVIGDLASKTCTAAVAKNDIQFLPDPSRKMVIIQHPSIFSNSQLQLGFNPNGTLNSVNSVSNPSTANILSTLETALKDKVLALSKAEKLAPPCNATPVIYNMKIINNLNDITQGR
jgi:hypothetical protein